MPQRVAKQTLYLNADRSKVVDEGDPDAAFLLVREGSAVNESEVQRLEKSGVKVNLKAEDAAAYDARADHDEKHGGETQAEADSKRAAMLAGKDDADGPAVEGERGSKSQDAPPDTKAVSKAPANKSA